jgi:hypothetical protein
MSPSSLHEVIFIVRDFKDGNESSDVVRPNDPGPTAIGC